MFEAYFERQNPFETNCCFSTGLLGCVGYNARLSAQVSSILATATPAEAAATSPYVEPLFHFVHFATFVHFVNFGKDAH